LYFSLVSVVELSAVGAGGPIHGPRRPPQAEMSLNPLPAALATSDLKTPRAPQDPPPHPRSPVGCVLFVSLVGEGSGALWRRPCRKHGSSWLSSCF
jgi:hypothetical protein